MENWPGTAYPLRLTLMALAALVALFLVPCAASAAGPPEISAGVAREVSSVLARRQKQVDGQGYDVRVTANAYPDNFNDDGLPDFVLVYGDAYHCGTGGCVVEFYQGTGAQKWRKVYEYEGSRLYHLSSVKAGGQREIVYLAFVSGSDVSAVARWRASGYELARYVTAQIDFVPTQRAYVAPEPTPVRDHPFAGATVMYDQPALEVMLPLATSIDGRWHMLQLSPSVVGFVSGEGLKETKRRRNSGR